MDQPEGLSDALRGALNATGWLFHLFDKPDMAVWVTDSRQFLLVEQYGTFKVDFKKGDLLKPGGTPAMVLKSQKRMARLVPPEVYGVACKSIALPLDGGVLGVSFSVAHEEELQKDLSRLQQVASDISQSGVTIADNAQSLSAFMGRVHADLEQTRVQLQAINELGDLIAGIAEETRYISLNAVIESKRAGEMGNAFAVVANEMKSLSIKTRDSVRGVHQTLEAIQERFAGLASVVAEAEQQVQAQSSATHHISDNLREVSQSVERIGQNARRL